MNDLIDTEQ